MPEIINDEALRVTSFEPSAREVKDTRNRFDSFILPELEIQLVRKLSTDLINAFDVVTIKVALIVNKLPFSLSFL